ncbi:hypothetical protein [Streptomyces sp. NPDC006274]|uniref:hypothetical protein n=1 Tax=unclassified Streptomyces TaxID=2593676 RepID=UPI0033BEEE59
MTPIEAREPDISCRVFRRGAGAGEACWKLRAEPGDTFAGCLVHVCVPKTSGLGIYHLWESEEAMNNFATVMMPVAERMGLTAAAAPPEIMPVHRYDFPSP